MLLRIDRYALSRIRRPPERNPKLFCILVALGGHVLPAALGLQPLPGSLEQTGPTVLAQGSSALVVLGAWLCAGSMLWPRRDTGIAIEFAGATLLALGLSVYSYALAEHQTIANSAYVQGFTIGLVFGCAARAAQIGLYVRGRKLHTQIYGSVPPT